RAGRTRKIFNLTEWLTECHEALSPASFKLNKGIEIPKELFIPGGSGKIYITNYADFLATMIRIQVLSGCFSFSTKIEDSNLAQQGNQEMTNYYATATDAIKAIVENTTNQGIRIEALLNIGIRLGIASVQQQKELGWLRRTIDSISAFLGFPRREKIDRIPTNFDPSLGVRKKIRFRGFGPAPQGTNRRFENEMKKIARTLEEGDPKALDKVLDDFLSNEEIPILFEDFSDEEGAPTLLEIINGESLFEE
ncbi:MAG: hypothetical protein F6K35_32845, partial [Okeania sp. SIO2H7]|nr:hypothetical protein [Okeania sp. SIO2H7]